MFVLVMIFFYDSVVLIYCQEIMENMHKHLVRLAELPYEYELKRCNKGKNRR